ncbi:MAG: hypothetical protein M1833_006019 [Piccolia ochrophora]|nr:MAG: hypothetical protein M1833_006019 [Piccolia ochrophora]
MADNNPLGACVASLKTSMALLDSSISILSTGVHDFPRLAKVLHTTRHFELTSEPVLRAAQDDLRAEIQPSIVGLLERASAELERLERRKEGLIARGDLLEGRLGQQGGGGGSARRGSVATRGGGGGAGGNAERLRLLRARRERLEYTVQRLGLQAGQRERQLRMSMAAQ